MRIDGKDGLMKKIYTGKSLDELKALAISEIKELGVDEADIKITVVEEPVKKLFGKKGDYKIEVEFETVTKPLLLLPMKRLRQKPLKPLPP